MQGRAGARKPLSKDSAAPQCGFSEEEKAGEIHQIF